MMETVDKLKLEIKPDSGNPNKNAKHIEIAMVPKIRINKPKHKGDSNAL